ncbi:MAG: hypothetical protein NZ602_03435 [Thermoguttaceae bacterium]|nr:hypothetical protein [Thermoguttaceae bacterium]
MCGGAKSKNRRAGEAVSSDTPLFPKLRPPLEAAWEAAKQWEHPTDGGEMNSQTPTEDVRAATALV